MSCVLVILLQQSKRPGGAIRRSLRRFSSLGTGHGYVVPYGLAKMGLTHTVAIKINSHQSVGVFAQSASFVGDIVLPIGLLSAVCNMVSEKKSCRIAERVPASVFLGSKRGNRVSASHRLRIRSRKRIGNLLVIPQKMLQRS
jgi:hypothetical protein